MILWLYGLAMTWAQPLLRAKLRKRAVAEPVYGEAVSERFGFYEQPASVSEGDAAHPLIWVHAVSLGETRAASVLVDALRQEFKGMRLLLTHGTATGRVQGRSLLRDGDIQVWQPWDSPGAVGRFLAHFRPHMGLLLETEIWPTLVAGCAQAGIPLCLVNARLSKKSLGRALKLSWLARPAYAGLAAVWAQSAADAERLQSLGAPVRGVMGNFKFDMAPDARLCTAGRAWREMSARPVLMFASSREGEEQMLLEVLKRKRSVALLNSAQDAMQLEANSVQWLIVPRHPQRFDAVEQMFLEAGFSVSRRSLWADQPEPADVWLGDSVGEMASYFNMADVALLGGSFAPLGGQNLIEAAACGCPVVMGPHTFNFTEAALLAAGAGAAFEVSDMGAAVERATRLSQSTELQTAREASLQLGLAHRGAAQRTTAALRKMLTSPAAR